MIETVVSCIGDILDAFTLIFLYNVVLGKKYKVNKIAVHTIFVVTNLTINGLLSLVEIPFLNMAVWLIVFGLLAMLYDTKWYMKIIVSVSYNILGIVAEFIVAAILGGIYGEEVLVGENYIIGLIISKLVMLVFVIVISFVLKRKNYTLDIKYRLGILLSVVIGMFTIAELADIAYNATDSFIPQVGVASISIAVLNYILYSLLDGLTEMYEVKQREALLKKDIELREEQFVQIASNYKQFRSVIHDTNKHLKTIAGMIEASEDELAVSYIKETLNEVNGSYIKVNTGNIVVDALVSSMINRCEEINIKCITDISVNKEFIEVSNHDLTVVLGNLIDNAVNATSKILDKDKRYIEVTLITDEKRFMIDILNGYDESEKETLRVGYGLGNIEETVTRNKGTYTVVKNDNTYRTSVIFYHSIL